MPSWQQLSAVGLEELLFGVCTARGSSTAFPAPGEQPAEAQGTGRSNTFQELGVMLIGVCCAVPVVPEDRRLRNLPAALFNLMF